MVDQHSGLLLVVEQIQDLACGSDSRLFKPIIEVDIRLIQLIVIEVRILGDVHIELMVLVAVHVVGPGQVKIPRMDLPIAGLRIVVIVEVLAEGDIIMMNALAEIAWYP